MGAVSQAVNGEPYSGARVLHLSTGPSDLCKAIAVSEAILVSGIGDVVVSALLKVNSAAPWHEFRIMEYDAVRSLIQPGNPTVPARALAERVTMATSSCFSAKFWRVVPAASEYVSESASPRIHRFWSTTFESLFCSKPFPMQRQLWRMTA